MIIKLNIDTQELKNKPETFDGRLRNRLCNKKSIKEIPPEELMTAVTQGRSFTPAAMTGTTGNTWQSQQVICADIDNDSGEKDANGNKIRIDNPLTPEHALEIMKEYGIDPYFMYKSFNYRDDYQKFRVVLVLDEPITDPDRANDIINRFTGIFNKAVFHCADTTAADNARLYYGGKPDCIMYHSGKITPLSLLSELPAIPNAPEAAEDEAQEKIPALISQANNVKTYSELQAQFEADKNSFDLAAYIMQTTNSRPKKIGSKLYMNPCPLCEHNDDFNVTRNKYHCFSASPNGGTGGTIIDYLIHKEKIDKGAACEKFKFEIMGYDKEEWKQAYLRENGYSKISSAVDRRIDEGYSQHTEEKEAAQERERKKDDLEAFYEKIQTEAYKPCETGLDFFDNLLNGGIIQQSLLLLMAAPGTGKTALAQQCAEAMAINKKPIIYLNLEMSTEQMLARAISAKMGTDDKKQTAIDVLQGYKWTEEQREDISAAINEYRRDIYPYLKYNPDNVGSDLDKIIEYLTDQGKKAKAAGKPAPAVVLDYLHLVTTSKNLDNQELIKQTVVGMKNYAKDYDTFVICIIATNRASNKGGKLTLESGRDSSNLEYTGDYIISLNYTAIDNGDIKADDVEELAKLQKEEYRDMTLRILKGRMVPPGLHERIYFNAAHNTFLSEAEYANDCPYPTERNTKKKDGKPTLRL